MTLTELRLGKLRFNPTDGVVIFGLLLMSVLTLLFRARVEHWADLFFRDLAVLAVYVGVIHGARVVPWKWPRFAVRAIAVALSYGYLFEAVAQLQLGLYGHWLDGQVLAVEQSVFGVQPIFWLERITSPPLTEWMMFAYIFYFPMYPLLCAVVFHRHGPGAMEDYLFCLGITNLLCDIGFILLPVAGPMAHLGSQFTVPLDGSVCTAIGEYIRHNLQFPGGSIPSPHCAAATIMWVMAWRYRRSWFYFLTPVVLSLYVSTFYCRYHYVSDAVVGVAVAFAALAAAPGLLRGWDRTVGGEKRAAGKV